MNKNDKILITGCNGLVGSAIIRHLKSQGYINVCGISKKECDLTKQNTVLSVFKDLKPDYVFHAAARVYGIGGNLKNKAASFYDNIMINTNVIDSCHKINVKKIVAMGTVAAYPYYDEQIILKEDMIFSGKPHQSEDSYGYAKRAMLAMLYAYKESYNLNWSYVICTNLYGPDDKFDILNGHVIPSLIRKFYNAKLNNEEITVWGDGSPQRNFMYIDDLAAALLIIMNNHQDVINVGTNEVVTIKELVETIISVSGFKNKVVWDKKMPNGRDYFPSDLSKLTALGFSHKFDLRTGIKLTWEWFNNNHNLIRS